MAGGSISHIARDVCVSIPDQMADGRGGVNLAHTTWDVCVSIPDPTTDVSRVNLVHAVQVACVSIRTFLVCIFPSFLLGDNLFRNVFLCGSMDRHAYILDMEQEKEDKLVQSLCHHSK